MKQKQMKKQQGAYFSELGLLLEVVEQLSLLVSLLFLCQKPFYMWPSAQGTPNTKHNTSLFSSCILVFQWP
jgi:hypothetical protein